MSGLFSTLNVGKRGMFAQQKAIDVTSHNIANAGTEGYSRQRAVLETTRPYTSMTTQAGQIGTGVQVAAIQRVRDTFLDYQVRVETSELGKNEVKSNVLQEVEAIFNEPSETGISTLLGKFFDSFQELSKQPNSSNARTVVAQQTAALCDALNGTYTKLEKQQTNAQDSLRAGVIEMNSLLEQLSKVNKEIIDVSVAGNTPNDLMDKRDLLVDQLSKKFNLTVDSESFEGIELKAIDTPSRRLPNLVTSEPGGEVSRFSYVTSIVADPDDYSGQTYIVTYYKNGNMQSEENKQTMKVTGLTPERVKEIQNSGIIYGNTEGQAVKADGHPIKDGEIINASQLMLFEPKSGDISGIIEIQNDLSNYMEQLNKMAKGIALTVNTVHSGMADPINYSGKPEIDALPFFVNRDTAKYDKYGLLNNKEDTLTSEAGITAKNISINKEILGDVMKIKTKTNDYLFSATADNYIDGEGDGKRALAIAQLKNTLFKIQDMNVSVVNREDLFDVGKGGSYLENSNMTIANNTNGTNIENYFKDIINKLGVQSQEAQRVVQNQEDLLFSLEENRTSVSGVSLDEEMANLVQFQHSYNANAKIIATVDELLDVVINGLKR